MPCHICQVEAITRCHTCGELICAEHGGKDDLCTRCSGGFVAGDPRTRISDELLGTQQHHGGWWRPQEAETYTPPSCYECQGLTRAVCRNCQCNYCRDHAGPNGLCKDCGRSANLGLYIIAAIFGLVTVLLLCQWFFGK
ncbi:MAG: hypothetical protein EXR98_10330 [Gemmataceae bacterium]|nr:hypothetical protein [Gemmataceae bacterium]